MSRFLLSHHRELEPYVPGEQPQDRQYVKLNTNENPYPPSPRVLEVLRGECAERLNLYPDPLAKKLREAIAGEHGLGMENVFVANGSDEVLGFAFLAYGDEAHPVVIPETSYGFYRIFAKLFRTIPQEISLNEDFTIPAEKFHQAKGMVVLANPNAPTALALSLEDLEGIVHANPEQIVLIDEAYVAFGGESALPLLSRYENLLIVRTYSKSHSLAGGRLGYALASRAIIEDLERIKSSFHPYSVNSLTLGAGIAAMEDKAYFRDCVEAICRQREETAQALRELGFFMTESRTNFLLVRHPKLEGKAYYEGLKQRGVLVRYLSGARLENAVRITIGTRQQMERLLEATMEILQEASA